MGGYWSKNTCSKLLRSMLYLGLQICFANQWIDFYVIPIAFCFNSDINKFPFFINFHRFFHLQNHSYKVTVGTNQYPSKGVRENRFF